MQIAALRTDVANRRAYAVRSAGGLLWDGLRRDSGLRASADSTEVASDATILELTALEHKPQPTSPERRPLSEGSLGLDPMWVAEARAEAGN